MQCMVIWRTVPGADPAAIAALMEAEEHYAWRDYMAGRLRQFWTTDVPGTVVMLFEYESLAEAVTAHAGLPLLKAGLIEGEWHALRPFQSWEWLFQPQHRIAGTAAATEKTDA